MTRLPAYPHGQQHTTTVARLVFGSATAAVATMHAIHDAVEAADPSTSDPLHALIVGLEKDSAPAEPVGAVPAQQRGVPWT